MSTGEGPLQTWTGREERGSGVVDPASVARMAATLDRITSPQVGEPLPVLWHWMLRTPTVPTSALGADGHPPLGGFLPDLGLPRRMWAGSQLRYTRRFRVGDTVEWRSKVQNMQRKQGRNGPLAFVTLRNEFQIAGEKALEEEQVLVYRAAAAEAASPAGRSPDRAAQFSAEVMPQTPLLFRYAALTFNAHRIHYDRDYAKQQEGYPGLVVPGPLTAALLTGLFEREYPSARIRALSIRAEAPLFDTAPFSIHGWRQGPQAQLWGQTPQGAVAMSMELELEADA
jgi:3-methylfumaryl-CoA hydratase